MSVLPEPSSGKRENTSKPQAIPIPDGRTPWLIVVAFGGLRSNEVS